MSHQPQQQQSQQQRQQQQDARPRRDSASSGGPQLIGAYRLGREIGKGSFAVVVKAYHEATKEPVAIKVVTRKKLTAKLLENLDSEISILKSIQHPNIVDLRDRLKTDSHIYLVMAYCSCGDLSGYIKKRGQISADSLADSTQSSTFDLAHAAYPHPIDGGLNEAVVRSFLSQLASAIEFMRAMNIVHRDIKPQNLLLQPPEGEFVQAGHPLGIHQLKVADFGFARSLPAASLAETLCGSPLYMAPEILRYEKYDAKADLWSVGAVLFEMAVGKAPFRAQNHIELLRKIERGEDRIKFPDERSAGSLARENARRAQEGERPLPPPHHIAEDIKMLIRALLKRKAVERMSFEHFFRSPVIQRIEMRASVAGLEVSTTIAPPKDRDSTSQLLSAQASETRPHPHMMPHQEPEPQPESPPPPELEPQPAEPQDLTEEGSGSTDDAYVLIDKPNVEVNALADEFQASPSRPSSQLPNQTQLPPHTRAQSISNPIMLAQQQSPRPSMMGFSPSSLGSGNGAVHHQGAISIHSGGVSVPASSSSSLARAISMASVKLFGVPTGMSLRGAAAMMRMQSQRRLGGVRPGEASDPAVAGLLAALEDLGQKAFVLSEFGDSRLAAFFPTGPHQPPSFLGATPSSDPMDPYGGTGAVGMAGPSSYSTRGEGMMAPTHSGSPRMGWGPQPGAVEPGTGTGSVPRYISRRSESSSSIPLTIPSPPRPGPEYAQLQGAGASPGTSSTRPPTPAELAATEALMLHIRALNFIQRGMNMVRTFLDVHSRDAGSMSAETNDAVQWLRTRFNDTYEKVEFAKARSGDLPESAQDTDKLIFERALEIARVAAVDEMENNREGTGWDRGNCVLAYETAHTMLLTLLDPSEQDMALSETSVVTVEKFVRSISKRLQALRVPLTPVQS
ncbi:hypothetical protein A4X13_0g7118 [Tilletia indica]|uniref:non-specific serine/threonine protein kinase n=1 Tax=Tilletia indica TaxID=43049 RepID=A0A177T4V8_9BASI|nr:hypothetical protein A4X13_0g7118 [Tilletia indica]